MSRATTSVPTGKVMSDNQRTQASIESQRLAVEYLQLIVVPLA